MRLKQRKAATAWSLNTREMLNFGRENSCHWSLSTGDLLTQVVLRTGLNVIVKSHHHRLIVKQRRFYVISSFLLNTLALSILIACLNRHIH